MKPSHLGIKVKGQGHDGIEYAGNSTLELDIMITWKVFDQTYTRDALWNEDELVRFGGQKVKWQSEIAFVGHGTLQLDAYGVQRLVMSSWQEMMNVGCYNTSLL